MKRSGRSPAVHLHYLCTAPAYAKAKKSGNICFQALRGEGLETGSKRPASVQLRLLVQYGCIRVSRNKCGMGLVSRLGLRSHTYGLVIPNIRF